MKLREEYNSKFDFDSLADFKDEVVKKYPKKVGRKRAKAIQYVDPDNIPETQANVRTIPGIITQRGCTYAGCKGVVLGPSKDILCITHGPIGCAFYSWLTRRNQADPGEDGQFYIPYACSTDMQEGNIVFGGEKKLSQAIIDGYHIFKPKAIAVFSTCPVGLIGDDVHRVARQTKEQIMKEFGDDVNIFGFSCEGYRGVSQSAGHHIANNQLYRFMIGNNDNPKIKSKYRVNVLGEYNIGGDSFAIEALLKKCGIQVVATFSGDSDLEQFETAHTADLSMVMCHRSINYVAEMLETGFGIPWIKVNFIGAKETTKTLRKIAAYFNDPELTTKIEEVIAEEMKAVDAKLAEIRPKTEGKTAMLFVGGSRAHHYQHLFADMGMTTLAGGYEFGHRDDYEGRVVIPTIQLDADVRNIETITVTADETRFSPRKTEAELAEMEKKMQSDGESMEFSEYHGMMSEMYKGAVSIDDLSHYEMDLLIEKYHPDIFCAGVKEKYCVQKLGIPMKQLHNYDSGGPYASYEGCLNFYKDIEQMVCSSIWKEVKAPWEKVIATAVPHDTDGI